MHLHDLVIRDPEKVALKDVVLDEKSRLEIEQFIKEHQFVDELSKFNLPVNNKILLQGSSGCGKTTTAKAIANALGKPIFILNLSTIICSRIGETSQNIKQVFDKAGRTKSVLFLDEFDQIGKERDSSDKEVGEMRRLVNTLIQLIDYYPNDALLISATNHPEIIDSALIRRFQLRINFELPNDEVLNSFYNQLLSKYPEDLRNINRKLGISFAEAKDHALTQVKSNLIGQLEKKVVIN